MIFVSVRRIVIPIAFINFCLTIGLLYVLYSRPDAIAYVDTQVLLNEYSGMKDAREKFRLKEVVWKSNLDTLASELERIVVEFETKRQRLSVNEIDLYKELINDKKTQLRNYHNAVEIEAQRANDEIASEVITEINIFLRQYGEANGYVIVFAANQYGNIAFADQRLDITDQVLTELNGQFGLRE